jgi:hypothetical protein
MSTSLDALIALPTTMMWRGLWNISIQYVKNEVVVSPLDNRTYILLDTASLDGLDPSLNPAWYVFTGIGGAGVGTVQTGIGITNIGSNTNPTLENSGIIEVKQGTGGISITGTLNNPIINCLGVNGFNQGLGILINGNEIINNGIRHIAVGGGLTLSGLFDKTLNTNSILSVTTGQGISNIGTAQSPILDNIGVTQLTTPVGGLTLSATTGPITCSNNGVLTLTAGSGISITGNTISTSEAILCKLFNTITSSSGFPLDKFGQAFVDFTVTSPFFNSCMLNGAPDPNGLFTIDLSSFSFYTYGDTLISTLSLLIFAIDTTTNTSYQITGNRSYPFNPVAFYPTLGIINMPPVSILRAAGMRSLTRLQFSTLNAEYILTSTGPVTAIYYPSKN